MTNLKTLNRLMVRIEAKGSDRPPIMERPQTLLKKRYTKTVLVKKKKRTHDYILRQAARQQAIYRRMSWRDYQNTLNQTKNSRRRVRRIVFGALLVVIIFAAYLFWPHLKTFNPIGQNRIASPKAPSPPPLKSEPAPELPQTSKMDIRGLIDTAKLLNLTQDSFEVTNNQHVYKVETSLDPALQTTLIDQFDKVNSRYIGIVVLEPHSGRILAFTGFNKTQEELNPCTTNRFPAASIFKIVTAAAASEKFGYTGDTRMKFNGFKHTLYKNQLKDQDNRYTNHISFQNSFAQSVNPVFGKIGALQLGKEALEKYGKTFGFNTKISADFDIEPSHLKITDDTYHHAEIASGFNRDTTLSPVHAAIIVAMALNDGALLTPTIVDRVIDQKGQPVYNSPSPSKHQVIHSQTAMVLQGMMEATVKSGTARKAFRGYTRDKILKKLIIGGKTGSIYNKPHDARFDWFVGFANTKDRSESIVISVVVAHEEYIGRRAGEYARLAFKTHFKNYFAREEAKRRLEDKS